jgi:eukaryotic-like serine/threonine-protein kinase
MDRKELARLAAASKLSLPEDHVALTGRRLAIAAALTAALYATYTVLYQTLWAEARHPVGVASGIVGMLVALGTAVFLFTGQRSARAVTAAGIGFELLITLVLGISEASTFAYAAPSPQVPWGAVVIALFPFLLPASPGIVLAASLGAAAMTPLGMAIVFGLGDKAWPDASVASSVILPPFFCALLAWAPTSTIYRLGVAVQNARRLGNYELGERLGGGGMGEVWRAHHRLLARPAAVKLIKPDMLGARDDGSRDRVLSRFEEEARVTASLESQHTVELYDFGVSAQGELFYVMELLVGLDAETLVERYGPLPPERVAYLLLQACDSLDDAHARGLVHRDIKPANLFVARKGVEFDFLKVLDFGLVKRWQGPEAEGLTRSLAAMSGAGQTAAGQIVGTPAFIAPEAAVGRDGVDHRADLYALGCVGYWLLTGSLVFDDASPIEMVISHVTKVPVPPSARSDRPLDPSLERIVLQCLAKDREQRPASARELRRQLADIAFAEPWSRERAELWWDEHCAELARSPSRGTTPPHVTSR